MDNKKWSRLQDRKEEIEEKIKDLVDETECLNKEFYDVCIEIQEIEDNK